MAIPGWAREFNIGRKSPLSKVGSLAPSLPNSRYDMGPEEFSRKMKLADKELDIKREQASALANLNIGKLGVQQQNADTNRFRADVTAANRDMTDEEKVVAGLKRALEVEAARQAGATARNDASIAGRAAEGAANRGVTQSEGQLNRDSRESIANNANEVRRDLAAENANRPGPLAAQLKARFEEAMARNPEYRSLISWDDDAKAYVVAPAEKPSEGWFSSNPGNEDLRRRIMQEIYGPQGSQPVMPGVGSAALGGNPGQGLPASDSIQPPHVAGPISPMTKVQTNARTGAKRTMVSMDGGKTWQEAK